MQGRTEKLDVALPNAQILNESGIKYAKEVTVKTRNSAGAMITLRADKLVKVGKEYFYVEEKLPEKALTVKGNIRAKAFTENQLKKGGLKAVFEGSELEIRGGRKLADIDLKVGSKIQAKLHIVTEREFRVVRNVAKIIELARQLTPSSTPETSQILSSPRTTEAQRITSRPAAAAYRQGIGTNLTRAVVPGVVEAEAALLSGGMVAYGAGYPELGGLLLRGGTVVPVVGAGLVAGNLGGNLVEAGARKLGFSEPVAKASGLFSAVAAGAGVGALIGSPIGVIPGTIIGGAAGLLGYTAEALAERFTSYDPAADLAMMRTML